LSQKLFRQPFNGNVAKFQKPGGSAVFGHTASLQNEVSGVWRLRW